MKSKNIGIIGIIVTVVLVVIGAIILPEEIIIQFSFHGGDPTIQSKWIALLIPLLLGVGGSIGVMVYGEDKMFLNKKPFYIEVVGIISAIIMIVVNLLVK